MMWDQITLIYKKWHRYLNYDEVIKKSQDRVNNNPIFKLVDQTQSGSRNVKTIKISL